MITAIVWVLGKQLVLEDEGVSLRCRGASSEYGFVLVGMILEDSPSASPMSRTIPAYPERSQHLSSPVVRWLAKPAPPRVLMSRLPWNRPALSWHSRKDCAALIQYASKPRDTSLVYVSYILEISRLGLGHRLLSNPLDPTSCASQPPVRASVRNITNRSPPNKV